jgi:hypothetical protein
MRKKTVTLPDNPHWDCTDGAHPAWWRGCDYGVESVIRTIRKAVAERRAGNYGSAALTELVREIIQLMEKTDGSDHASDGSDK